MKLPREKTDYDPIAEFSTRTRLELAHQDGALFRKDTSPPMEEIEWVMRHLAGTLNVLELGCGFGPYAEVARACRARYTGVDVVPARIALARERCSYDRATFVCDDARSVRIPTMNGALTGPLMRFDAVLIVTVLQHLPLVDAIQVLQTAAAHLIPGGRVLMLESRIFDVSDEEAAQMYADPKCAAHMVPKSLRSLQASEPSLRWECQVDGKHDGYILTKTTEGA